jgi:hypothetical protein
MKPYSAFEGFELLSAILYRYVGINNQCSINNFQYSSKTQLHFP